MPLLITEGLGIESGDANFILISTVASDKLVTLTLNQPLFLTGLAEDYTQYVFTSLGDGIAIEATGVTASGNQILIDTTEQTDGALYQLNIPPAGIISSSDSPFQGSFEPTFTGVGIGATILMSRAIDAYTVEIFYSEAVNNSDATDIDNYSIDNGLEVTAAIKITDTRYQIKTTRQVEGLLYTITVSNVRNYAGNPV